MGFRPHHVPATAKTNKQTKNFLKHPSPPTRPQCPQNLSAWPEITAQSAPCIAAWIISVLSMTFSIPEAGPADGSVRPLSSHPNPRRVTPKASRLPLQSCKADPETPPAGSVPHRPGHRRLSEQPPGHPPGNHPDSTVTLYARAHLVHRAEAPQEPF